jgi:hypothetical protein
LGDSPATTVVGAVSFVTGLVAFGVQIVWYAVDEGRVAVGGDLSGLIRLWRARGPMALALALGVAALGGFIVLVSRQGASSRSNRILVTVGVLGCIAALASIQWYPQNTEAVLVAVDPDTGVERWRAATGATTLIGFESESSEELVVVADKYRRGCRCEKVAITFDAMTGDRIDVRQMPTWYPNVESLPEPPSRPDPTRYRLEQGETTVVCQS